MKKQKRTREPDRAVRDGEVLSKARPLLLRALVKSGRAATMPPADPKVGLIGQIGSRHPTYKMLGDLDTQVTWRDLREQVYESARELAGLAIRFKLDAAIALRVAFLMRLSPDHPLSDPDSAAIVDLGVLVAMLGKLCSEPVGDESAVGGIYSALRLDDRDREILEVLGRYKGAPVKFCDLYHQLSFSVDESALRKRLVKLEGVLRPKRGWYASAQ